MTSMLPLGSLLPKERAPRLSDLLTPHPPCNFCVSFPFINVFLLTVRPLFVDIHFFSFVASKNRYPTRPFRRFSPSSKIICRVSLSYKGTLLLLPLPGDPVIIK